MTSRVRAQIEGRVQGVGFRPTVFRHARLHGLTGHVKNISKGIIIEIQGSRDQIEGFFTSLSSAPPPMSRIDLITQMEIQTSSESEFHILPSERSGDLYTGMPPDLGTCKNCENELLDPNNRRFGYPFINCTNCGPRFTIINQLPYDRQHTSMHKFTQCELCFKDYSTESNIRFDAQPNACQKCGPKLRLIDNSGGEISGNELASAVSQLEQGAILAVKGIGGFHLACNARDQAAVSRLRNRKKRPYKALAVMFRSVEAIQQHCRVSEPEARALESPVRPIVICARKPECALPANLSPDTQDLGVMLPYTPLHFLLLNKIQPLVMTSCNASEEPIVWDEKQLGHFLGSVADFALVHDRPILRPCDDSVMKISMDDHPHYLRRSRGLVPDPIRLPMEGPPVLACGADNKNTFCLTRQNQAFLSQHLGDVNDYAGYQAFGEQIHDLKHLLGITPQVIAHDLHPDYRTTHFAQTETSVRTLAVQHHHAHIASCMAEHQLTGRVIGIALDGSGYGPDHTVWGGEILIADYVSYQRRACLKTYALPGGEQAIRQPVRMALSYLHSDCPETWEAEARRLFPEQNEEELARLSPLLVPGPHSPGTTSAGRLFDAVAALLGLNHPITYEGQAAVRLQTLAASAPDSPDIFPYTLQTDLNPAILDFGPMIRALLPGARPDRDPGVLAYQFHRTLATALVQACVLISQQEKLDRIVLSGGVWQNDLLLGLVKTGLAEKGLIVYSHERVPANDGGLSLGQAAVALAMLAQEHSLR